MARKKVVAAENGTVTQGKQVKRTYRICWQSADKLYTVLRITQDGISTEYLVRQLGVGNFSLTKLVKGGEIQYICQPASKNCTCIGFTTHKKCKHLELLTALVASNKI